MAYLHLPNWPRRYGAAGITAHKAPQPNGNAFSHFSFFLLSPFSLSSSFANGGQAIFFVYGAVLVCDRAARCCDCTAEDILVEWCAPRK